MRLAVLWITVAALCEQSLQLGFARPFYTQFAVGPGIYGTNQVWTLGDVQEVVFDTPWPEYRIEFWQNSLVAGARLSEKPAYQRENPLQPRTVSVLCIHTNFGLVSIRDSRSKATSEV